MKSGFRHESNRIEYGGGEDYGSRLVTVKESRTADLGVLDAGCHGGEGFATASMALKEGAKPSTIVEAPERSGLQTCADVSGKSSRLDGESVTPDFRATLQLSKPDTARKRNEHPVFAPTAEFNNEDEATDGSLDPEQSSFDVVLRRVSREDSNLMSHNSHVLHTGETYSRNLAETEQSQYPSASKEVEVDSEAAASMMTEVYSWGTDKHGQLGLGEKFSHGKQVYPVPKCCSYNIAISKIGCGDDHSIFITQDSFVYSMGSNAFGQLGINDPQTRNKYSPVLIEVLINKQPKDVACGSKHSMVLCQGLSRSSRQPHGEVYAWGDNEFGQTGGGGSAISAIDVVYSPRLVNLEAHYRPSIVKIDCGAKHSAFIDDIGRLFQCGASNFGQLGLGSFASQAAPTHVESITETVSSIACGTQHSVALTNKGKIWVMGANKNGELGIGRKYDDQSSPVFMKELSFAKIKQVRSGSFTAALSDEDQLYVWGCGAFGDFYTPHRVKSFKNHQIMDFQISDGGTGLVLTTQGDVYAWGANHFGQLGLSDFQLREKPHKVEHLDEKNVKQIAVGKNFSIALGETVSAEQESRDGETARSPSALSGVSSSVILRQESSLFSIDQHPRKASRQDSSGALAQKRPKSKSKKRLLKQESSTFGRADASPSPRVLKCHLKHGPKTHACAKIDKPKSYGNLHEGLRIVAKQMKKKSKSSSKLSSVPAAAQMRIRDEREVNYSIHSRRHGEVAHKYRTGTDAWQNSDHQGQSTSLKSLQINGQNNSKKKSRNDDDKKHEESLRRADELRKRVEEDKEHAKIGSLVLSESETTFRGNKIAANQCPALGGGKTGQDADEELRFAAKPSSRFDGDPRAHQFGNEPAPESRNDSMKVLDLTAKDSSNALPFVAPKYHYRSQLPELSSHQEEEEQAFVTRNRPDLANAYSRLDEISRRTEELMSPTPQQQNQIKILLREKELLAEDFKRSENQSKILAAENHELRSKLDVHMANCRENHSGIESKQKDIIYELDRIRKVNDDLEERLDQQRAVKENLRQKIKEFEGMFDGLTDKKNKAQSELRQALEEASQFRNDVSYLTKETEALLNDVLVEQKLRKTAEQQLEQLKDNLKESQLQMEEELRQLDKLQSKQDLLQQENDSQCRLLGQIREEKQSLQEYLENEREELREARLQLRELQERLPRQIEADKQEIEALKDQNEIYARDILDLRKSVAQFAKQSHEQQNDLDDQRKAEKALRFEKETLEEQVRSLKNEVRELDRSQSELEVENRRLNTRLNDEIMNRAGAYAQSTLSILNGRQSQSQLTSHHKSLPGLHLENATDFKNPTSHNSSVMIEFKNRKHVGEEDAMSHLGSGLLENSRPPSRIYNQNARGSLAAYRHDATQGAPFVEQENRGGFLLENYRDKKSDMKSHQDFREASSRAEYERPLMPRFGGAEGGRGALDHSNDAIRQVGEKGWASELRQPDNHSQQELSRGAQSISPAGRRDVYGLGMHYQGSAQQTKPAKQLHAGSASRFQSAEPSARYPVSSTKSGRGGGISSLLGARYERERSLHDQKLEAERTEAAEAAGEERLAASQVVRASLADLKSRLNDMRAERVFQKAAERSIIQEGADRSIDPCREEVERQYALLDEEF